MFLANCKIIWSDILPRRNWIVGLDMRPVEQKRKRFNRAGRRVVASVNSTVIHPDIEFLELGLTALTECICRVLQSAIGAFISLYSLGGKEV